MSQPLDWRIPITDNAGRPSPEFQRKWAESETAWTTYTPIVTAAVGTFTSTSAVGRYKLIGKTLFLTSKIDITINGTADNSVIISLPLGLSAKMPTPISGRDQATTGFALCTVVIDNHVYIANYNNSYPGGNGVELYINGVIEII